MTPSRATFGGVCSRSYHRFHRSMASASQSRAAKMTPVGSIGDLRSGRGRAAGAGGGGGALVESHGDDVVDATHDEQVTVLVEVATIAAEVVPVVARQVRAHEAVVVVVERRQGAGRKGQADGDSPFSTGRALVAVVVEDPDVVPGH